MLQVRVFSDSELESIDRASLGILERVGLRLEHEQVRERLLAAGARPGARAEEVRFPRELVRECLDRAPRQVRFCGLSGREWAVGPGGGQVYWTAAAMYRMGPEGRQEFDRAELARMSRLVEALPHLDGIVGVSVRDAEPQYRDVAGFRVMAANTGKHIRVLSFSPRGVEAILEMARVLNGGRSIAERPIFSMGFTAHGPLRWTNLALEIYYASAGHGIPVMVNGEPTAGGTAPVTLAGAVTVGNAEILGGIVLNQVLEPGRPCIHNLGFAHILDMRTGTAVTGAPENCLLAMAGAELARYYGLPSASWMSSDAMVSDAQSAAEKTMAALTHTAAGVGVIWGAGTLESELCIGYGQLVIDDELIGQAQRLARGIEVSAETIAEELITRIGPCGNYLGEEHTFEHFRGELYETALFCRERRENWERAGALRLEQVAERRAEELIAKAEPARLAPEQERELDRIERRFTGGA